MSGKIYQWLCAGILEGNLYSMFRGEGICFTIRDGKPAQLPDGDVSASLFLPEPDRDYREELGKAFRQETGLDPEHVLVTTSSCLDGRVSCYALAPGVLHVRQVTVNRDLLPEHAQPMYDLAHPCMIFRPGEGLVTVDKNAIRTEVPLSADMMEVARAFALYRREHGIDARVMIPTRTSGGVTETGLLLLPREGRYDDIRPWPGQDQRRRNMTPALAKYLEGLRWHVAVQMVFGDDLPEEDEESMLDVLDSLWRAMSSEERKQSSVWASDPMYIEFKKWSQRNEA